MLCVSDIRLSSLITRLFLYNPGIFGDLQLFFSKMKVGMLVIAKLRKEPLRSHSIVKEPLSSNFQEPLFNCKKVLSALDKVL